MNKKPHFTSGRESGRATQGFTLVELIVVITILSILGTIGFVSFQGYTSSARDSVRISDLTNIQKGLDLYQVKAGSYPTPDNPTTFSGGINTILKQGILGDSVSKNINLNETVTDPLTKSNYIYSTISNGKYYQLYSELENTISYKNKLQIIPVSYADSNSKIPVIKGNYTLDPSLPSLLITDSTKSIATSSGIFDPNICFVLNNSTTNYISSSVGTCTPKKNLSLKDYDSSLVGYWDMETTFNSGGIDYLKDFSGNGNNGWINGWNNGTSNLPIIGSGSEGIFGQGTKFNTGGFIRLNSQTYLFANKPGITFIGFMKKNDVSTGNKCLWKFHKNVQGYWGACVGFLDGNFRIAGASSYLTGELNQTFTGSILLDSNNWQMISGIIDYQGKKMKYYLNGNLIGMKNINFSNNVFVYQEGNVNYDNIGFGTSSNALLNGFLDDIKIYNRVLPDEEIRQHAKIAGF
ncbi:prepilin-type N-terminal cleavage/methylation domain-containing protein [Candidatus Gracilibacteria bacterium]|nr:prepilin-type N-terminal cleavage/methylation domain-containing protein [Candidatus Gracilibacteria bacterium]